MPPSSIQTSDVENNFAKTQLTVFFAILILAVDSINPVKIIQQVFPEIQTWHIATLSIILMLYVFISEMKQLLYFTVKIFFHSLLSIFFREVNIIGHQNIPRYGPVIFISNHANQFMDSVVLLSTCQRTISFLMAEKSYRKNIVGHIAWAMGVVPVKRAQDSAFRGEGLITIEKIQQQQDGTGGVDGGVVDDVNVVNGIQKDTHASKDGGKKNEDKNNNKDSEKQDKTRSASYKIIGTDTKFTQQFKPKDKLRFSNCPNGLKVESIQGDTEMVAIGNEIEFTSEQYDVVIEQQEAQIQPLAYDILKRIEQSAVYEKVVARLADAGALGIFPEGGSHDRSDLLPLKAGASIIAYTALEKDGLNVPIVPVGLNYFQREKIRGRVTVEYGRPIYIDPETLQDYKSGGDARRKVCNETLERIEDSLRGVIVSAPDHDSLKIIHTARRLYRDKYISNHEKQDLSRRFAEGYKQILASGDAPQSYLNLKTRIENYQKELDELGIRDYQVTGLSHEQSESEADFVLRKMRIPFRIAELLLLLLVSLIPSLFLNVPVGIIAHRWAVMRKENALARSKVKIEALDVMLTEKVVLCIVLVPSLWIFYGLMLWILTDIDYPKLLLFMYSFPVAAYMGIVTTEAGMIELKDLKPMLKRLFPSTRKRMKKLPAKQKKLRKDLRDFINTIGPTLGDVYSEKKIDWADFQQNLRNERKNSTANLEKMKDE